MVSASSGRLGRSAGLHVLLRRRRFLSTTTTGPCHRHSSRGRGPQTRGFRHAGRSLRSDFGPTLALTAMTFRGFKIRLLLVATFTWVVGAIVDSFGWALYWALFLLFLYEVIRPRRRRDTR